MKYIDADKLKAEIERRKKEHMYDEMPITIGRYYEDRDLLAFIDSLQQEQPSSSDLDEAAQKVEDYYDVGDEHGYLYCHRGDIKDAFKAGAKWQYQKDRGEFAKIKAKTWCEGFDAHKEQMLKEAVEGYVNYYEDGGGKLMAEAQVGCPYHIGDKVKIIIVKEEEK